MSDICELNRKIESGDSLSGPLISAPSNRGMHGFTPDHDEMLASFFLIGPGVPPGRSLGEIDMRQIAPTLAEVMHVEKGHGVERSATQAEQVEFEPTTFDDRLRSIGR